MTMNNRQRVNAILHYEDYDRMPVVRFGFWRETLYKWVEEGHITKEQADGWTFNGNTHDTEIGKKLGFDFNWNHVFYPGSSLPLYPSGSWRLLEPPFKSRIIKELPDGTKHMLNEEGVIVLQKFGSKGIPAEVDYTLKDRKSWEKHYKPRLQFSREILDRSFVRNSGGEMIRFDAGGCELLQKDDRDFHYILYAGSIMGEIRNWLGLENFSFITADDPVLLREMVETTGEIGYQTVKAVLESGAKFDLIYFWEDLACKSGPLVSPKLFNELAGPQYKRITDLARKYGIDLAFVDSDGVIDTLIPTWINNGINIMFPIEVGTWGASIKEMRERYGRKLCGVGGMRKEVFAKDRTAIDEEIERLKPLVELGGYIPFPDHHITPDSKWDNVRYYAERMHKIYG